MFFYPMKQHVRTPSQIGLLYKDVYVNVAEKDVLNGWFLPATNKPKATILLLHGNAENISTHIGSVYWLPSHGFNVFLYDYRGYGKSTGESTVEDNINDVEVVIREIARQNFIANNKLILFGQSLGGAIAANAITNDYVHQMTSALVIESSFTDFQKIARDKLSESWLTWPLQWPLSLLVTSDFSPKEALKNRSGPPLLIIHGEDDYIIPVSHGIDLYQNAANPKQLWIIPGGQHIAATTYGEYQKKLVEYFDAVN